MQRGLQQRVDTHSRPERAQQAASATGRAKRVPKAPVHPSSPLQRPHHLITNFTVGAEGEGVQIPPAPPEQYIRQYLELGPLASAVPTQYRYTRNTWRTSS